MTDRPAANEPPATRAVYLDYNATAPLRPEAAAAVADASGAFGNPSSVHSFGRDMRRRIESARESLAALVGGPAEGVVFTGSGSEANNLALLGCGRPRQLVSAGEHESVLQACLDAEAIPLERDGRVRLEALEALLAADPAPTLVSVMLANNETGVIQPVESVVEIAKRHGAMVHCDAVQAAGRIPLDMTAFGIDLLSLSAHKLGGSQGVGALLLAEGVEVAPLIRGGGQERRRRAGTENVAGIAGFGAAAEAARRDLESVGRIAALRDALEREALALAPEAQIIGADAPRLPNTSCLALPGLAAETQVIGLDLDGIAVSAGSACSSGKVESSHVLRAMGLGEEVAGAAIRVSLGWASEEADIAAFLHAWRALYRRAGPGAERLAV